MMYAGLGAEVPTWGLYDECRLLQSRQEISAGQVSVRRKVAGNWSLTNCPVNSPFPRGEYATTVIPSSLHTSIKPTFAVSISR